MGTVIDSIGHRSIDANKVQPPQLTNESNKNIKHNINCLSTTRTVPIDYEVKLTGNYNSTCTEENVSIVANELTGHNELIGVQVQDQFKTVKTNKYIKKKKLVDNK
jgi:phosphopentomutase